MSRLSGLVLLGLAGAGCGLDDPCAGHDGTCIALYLQGTLPAVDQLHVVLSGAAQLDGVTAAMARPPRPLPLTTALYLPAVTGAVAVHVDALRAGAAVGSGAATVAVRPGVHVTLVIALAAGGAPDGALPVDGGGAGDAGDAAVEADLGVGDLGGVDLAAGDAAVADALPPGADQGADAALVATRLIFLLPARGPVLGAEGALDDECATSAAAAALTPITWRALVTYPGHVLSSEIQHNQGRNVVAPSGKVVCTDATLFTVSHALPIDELANGNTVAAGCVWTAMAPNGGPLPNPYDCDGWTADNPDAGSAGVGLTTASDVSWAFDNLHACEDPTPCFVYCLEQ